MTLEYLTKLHNENKNLYSQQTEFKNTEMIKFKYLTAILNQKT
jgi:hypothetical protein